MSPRIKYHEVQINVKNELGLHVRPAAQVADIALKYPHEILLCYNGRAVNAKSSTDLLTMAAIKGTTLTLKVSMKDGYEGAAKAIKKLFDDGFGELGREDELYALKNSPEPATA